MSARTDANAPHNQSFNVAARKNLTKKAAWWQKGNNNNKKV